MQLSNNIVLITGGSSGIGLALARAFLELQNTVIVCGRSMEKLEFVRKEYPGIHTIQCDITNDDDIQQMFDKIRTEFNGLNILINNAGIQYNYDFYEDNDALKKIDDEIDAIKRWINEAIV